MALTKPRDAVTYHLVTQAPCMCLGDRLRGLEHKVRRMPPYPLCWNCTGAIGQSQLRWRPETESGCGLNTSCSCWNSPIPKSRFRHNVTAIAANSKTRCTKTLCTSPNHGRDREYYTIAARNPQEEAICWDSNDEHQCYRQDNGPDHNNRNCLCTSRYRYRDPNRKHTARFPPSFTSSKRKCHAGCTNCETTDRHTKTTPIDDHE